jgi:ACDE family multidrug resistance protein
MVTSKQHQQRVTVEGATLESEKASMLRQPIAVWATALACVFAFMGIGLVDPILPAIAENLDAGPSEVSLLFTSYFAVTAVMMLITSAVSSRIGGKKTLLAGLALIVIFAALAGTSSSVGELVGFRAGWGLGNALFVATALAVIVAVASGGRAVAIILYEAALGLGMACGPLVGAVLGHMNWRGPFFGTAVLMFIALVVLLWKLPETPKPATKTGFLDSLKALRHGGLFGVSFSALFYNFGFFTVLAYTPFLPVIKETGEYGIGLVFFGWGCALAVCSVFLAPIVQNRIGAANTAMVMLVGLLVLYVLLGLFHDNRPTVIVVVIAAGALMGINNTVYTEMAMSVSDNPQPVASASYNFVRWMGGVIAPFASTKIADHFSVDTPYYVAAVVVVVAVAVMLFTRNAVEVHGPEAV